MKAPSNGGDKFGRLTSKTLARDSRRHKLLASASKVLPGRLRRSFGKKSTDKRRALLEMMGQRAGDVWFVQIGSCDGATGDPIYKYAVKYGWHGIVVEPVPYNFEQLRRNYADHGTVVCENKAISNSNDTRRFWYLRQTDDDIPHWYNQIGSFDRNHLLKHSVFISNIEEYLVEMSVECVTLERLLNIHNVQKIDLIHCDVEGFDFEVIKQIDFSAFRPKLILYEDLHLSGSDGDQCESLLTAQGYVVERGEMDAIAYLK